MIRVGVLTSSRADYGIYLPLLKAFCEDSAFNLRLIVFGTHLSKYHGFTVRQIEQDGFKIERRIESLLIGDTPYSVATSYALTTLKFAEFWEQSQLQFDIVFTLGDRFEMAAAVAAAVPFQITLAHIHGGETTLGAIDNIYRHFISLSSHLHFTATAESSTRLKNLLGANESKIFNIGSLSLENLDSMELLSLNEFKAKWNIDLSKQTILVTLHPETVDFVENKKYCDETLVALEELASDYQIVLTLPNADTSSLIYRESFQNLARQNNNIKLIENFGTQSYFTCMKYSSLMIGNTSSGIIEAASFNKYVLNLGNRQKGRIYGKNVIHIPFNAELIILKAKQYANILFYGQNIYFQPEPSKKIIDILKKEYASLS